MKMTQLREEIFRDILSERKRQEAKWGKQSYEPNVWLPILIEEVGEVAKGIQELTSCNSVRKIARENYRNELVQVAAVCVQMLEDFDEKNNV